MSRIQNRVAAGVASSALVLSAVALAAPAFAAPDKADPTFAPVAADLVGVGSDTSQYALHDLAEAATGFNATHPTAGFKIASFSATNDGANSPNKITLANGSAIDRPNGSGAGKKLLYGSGNNTEIDFARSSSAIDTTEAQAGLKAFPFALDRLQMAVSNSVASNAPASLTDKQIVDIYKGTTTDWSQVGGRAGVIVPMIPQAGSGTRSFFESQLQSINGGVKVVLAPTVKEVQEHDDTLIKGDANAVAPFSVGRAKLAGTTLRLEQGWEAKRALYNVVRGTDVSAAAVQTVFGPNGFVCSTAARELIEKTGFEQLATAAKGGVCGEATDTATSNFTLNVAVTTTTTLSGESKAAGSATLIAAVAAATAPTGTVSFFDGTTEIASNIPLISGQATTTVTGLAAGSHTYKAVFTPAAGSVFETSEGEGAVSIKAASAVAEGFAATAKVPVAKFKKAVVAGKVTVTLTGVDAKATGPVSVTKGAATVAKGNLNSAGTVTLKLPVKKLVTVAKLKKAKKKGIVVKLAAKWGGDANAVAASKNFNIKLIAK